MYTEEYLPDDTVFDDYMDISIETSTVDSAKIERKKIQELNRLNDPDYYFFKRYEETHENTLKSTRVRIFSSPMNGYIRNAPTGIREEYRVGSKYEDLFFVVKDTVCKYLSVKETGHKPEGQNGKLFYRSPEEFERHLKLQVPTSVKEDWNEKYLRAKSKLL
jgi:hypothetical protein